MYPINTYSKITLVISTNMSDNETKTHKKKQGMDKFCSIGLKGYRHSSVDPSAPTIMPPWVRIPSKSSKLIFHL